MGQFNGFGRQTTKFLRDLAAHNEREWFKDHKDGYDEHVLEPALAFISDVGTRLERISKHFDAVAKRSGGSLMRVYRDTRFSKDKTPHKTNIGIQFRHEVGKDVHAPGYYVHLEPDECFLGVGLWHPDSTALAAIRGGIVDDPKGWKRARDGKRFRESFALEGTSLKRAPRGFDEDHPLIEDLKRKDFIAVQHFKMGVAAGSSFTDRVSDSFKTASGYMRFLCGTLDLPF